MKTALLGKLIVFEGIDGTGKTTQLALLARHLCRKGYTVVTTREPTEGTYGKQIRELYLDRESCSREEELELFLADRREHVDSLILPALREGKIVLCDRYYLSTVAYQGAVGFDPDEILQRNDFAPVPDLALLFEVPISTSLKRITQGRGEQLNDFEQAESLSRVSRIFHVLNLPCIRRIDADRSIDAVHLDVLAATQSLILSPESVFPS